MIVDVFYEIGKETKSILIPLNDNLSSGIVFKQCENFIKNTYEILSVEHIEIIDIKELKGW